MTDFNLHAAFENLQAVLKAQLGACSVIGHPTEKGDNAELNWADMLHGFLPNRYGVGKAFAVDVNGAQSEQLDVVIYDCQYSPLLFHYRDGLYIPAESVYAVFEVKPEMNKANVEYAGAKIASVRRLERTSTRIPHAGGEYAPKAHAPIIGGILAVRSGWTPCFGTPFEGAVLGADCDHRIDIGCVLDEGGFELVENEGGLAADCWSQDEGLAIFAMRLFRRLQQLGTVPAIDILRWANAATIS